uniref:Leucine-rich repeat receptor-like protein kinase n=1 Tax=Pohlia nutans TaxID=140635 RepID=A0A1P8DYX4_9BRYO|nr:leucine-rich repeat receptor-like protein kinase [Pohlia nutans]
MASDVLAVWTALLVFSLHFFSGSSQISRTFMKEDELFALQNIWSAWKEGTPNLESNLAGWYTFNASEMASGGSLDGDPCLEHSWAGISCYNAQGVVSINGVNTFANGSNTFANGTQGSDPAEIWFTASVVSLTLLDSSIVGNFPVDAIGNLSSLSSLIIANNPNLTGPLVVPQGSLVYLKVVDLHGNAFTGYNAFSQFYPKGYIEYLDLSDNKLSGELLYVWFPKLRTMKLARNNFSGTVPLDYFGSGSGYDPLVTMDLSGNNFVGPLANLSYPSLYTLNLSSNAFNGTIDPVSVFNGSINLTVLDLSHNSFTGHMPNLGLLSALQTLDLSYNDFYPGQFPDWLLLLKGVLQILNLSGTNLIGELLLSSLNNFPKLTILKLDNNAINGTLDIDKISKELGAQNLQAISLQNNSITDVTYKSSTIQSLGNWLTINLKGNPYCNTYTLASDLQRCVCEQFCFDSNQVSSKSTKKAIVVATSTSSTIIAIIILISTLLFWKNKQEKQKLILALHQRFAEYEMKPTLYAYNELQKATKNFSADTKLGEGGYGAVYKGILFDGSTVAVKQLLNLAKQNMDDFLNEVVLLTGVKHRNLVKLKGCCLRETQRLLVYEYVENYDLSAVLFESMGNIILDWPTRLNICLGVAQGLHYLHALVEPRMIHRDIKASNILLDKDLQPKIADFGLALLFPDDQTHIITVHVAGTKGYLAPEYATYGQLSEKVDVFSFGVLVLEVLSGRRNIELNFPQNKAYLVVWAQQLFKENKLLDLVDPILKPLMDEDFVKVQQVINVALLCVQMEAEHRPSMAHVVAMLRGDMEIKMLENMQYSLRFDSTFAASTSMELGSSNLDLTQTNKMMLLANPSNSSNFSSDMEYLKLSTIKDGRN